MKPALVATATVLLLNVGCGSSGVKSAVTTLMTTNPTGTTSTTTHGRFQYPKSVTKNYMRSCTKNGQVKAAYCSCTLDKLSDTVSVGDFARIGLSGGTIPPRIKRLIRRAAVDCLDKL